MSERKVQMSPARVAGKTVKQVFTDRELRLIQNCMNYAQGDPAGLPGHNLMLIIAKLAADAVPDES